MTGRTVPQGLAPLLQLLELEQPRVVTAAQLRAWSSEVGLGWPFDVVVRRLRERGWLLDLATRGVWEFAPAARAGSYGSGDPLVELRATVARDASTPYAVGAESAAYLLGLAGRRPAREVVGAPSGLRPPKAFKVFRVVSWTPRAALTLRDSLPTWSATTLLAFMGTRPSGYRDWPNAGEWLAQAAANVTIDDLEGELSGRPRSAWARTAYLLDRGGVPISARELFAAAPRGGGPYYLGARRRAGRYAKAFDVIDSTGLEVRAL
jgi:hypothetical protein